MKKNLKFEFEAAPQYQNVVNFVDHKASVAKKKFSQGQLNSTYIERFISKRVVAAGFSLRLLTPNE